MKKNKNKWLILLLVVLAVSCQREQLHDPDELLPQAIGFAATSGVGVEAGTKTGATFPNGGKLSILADEVGQDWTTPYIYDVEVVTSDTGPIYGFAWQSGQTKYWPLDGTSLKLFAYTPKNAAYFSPVKSELKVTLPANNSLLPDLLYSAVVTSNKTSPNVNFGALKHLFSQLTVNVHTTNVSKPIALDEFSIIAPGNATYDIDDEELGVYYLSPITYKFASRPVLADATTYTLEAASGTPFKVFPDLLGANTFIYVRFTDGVGGALILEKKIPVSDFKTTGNVSTILERAKSIVLTIEVKGTQILNIALSGVIVPWVSTGDFESTIE